MTLETESRRGWKKKTKGKKRQRQKQKPREAKMDGCTSPCLVSIKGSDKEDREERRLTSINLDSLSYRPMGTCLTTVTHCSFYQSALKSFTLISLQKFS